MVCPSCGTAFEGRVCPHCGTDVQVPPPAPPQPPSAAYAYVCVRCGAMFSAAWCPYCGTPVGGVAVDSAEGARAIGGVFWTMSMMAFFALLIANLIVLAYASQIVIGGALAGGPRPIWLFVLTPFPVGPIVDASAEAFLGYFGLVLFAILATYGWLAFRDAKPTARALLGPIGDLRGRLESRSAWISTGQVFLAVLFFTFTYALILEFVGFAPTAPPIEDGGGLPSWYVYFALANAPVYEELVSRFLLIGVPLAIAAFFLTLYYGPEGTPPGAARVPIWRHLLGGTLHRDAPRQLVIVAAILITLSSAVFGLAHVPGYGLWKFLPTFVGGLGMGYLFVRRGLLAAILFHFATDYMVAMILLSAGNLGAQIVLSIFVLFLVGCGLFFFVWYFFYIAELIQHFLVAWGYRAPAPVTASGAPRVAPPSFPMFRAASAFPSVPQPPPPSLWGSTAASAAPRPAPPRIPGAWIGYVCPRCHGMEARYDAGRFTCVRCGHVT